MFHVDYQVALQKVDNFKKIIMYYFCSLKKKVGEKDQDSENITNPMHQTLTKLPKWLIQGSATAPGVELGTDWEHWSFSVGLSTSTV